MIVNKSEITPSEQINTVNKYAKFKLLFMIIGGVCILIAILFALIDFSKEDMPLVICMLFLALFSFTFGLFSQNIQLFVAHKMWDKSVVTYMFYETYVIIENTIYKNEKVKNSSLTLFYKKLKKYKYDEDYHIFYYGIVPFVLKSDGFESKEDMEEFIALAKDFKNRK